MQVTAHSLTSSCRFSPQGIGRRVLEAQGWAEGQGLGGSVRGSADIIDSEGQKPYDRSGLG